MSINDATRFDWDRLREAHPPLELDTVTSTANLHYTPSGLSGPLLEEYKVAAEAEQKEKDRQRLRDKWSKWCVTEKDIDDMMPEEDIHAAIAEARPDPVNNPSHYNTGGVEAIQAIEASMSKEAFQGYLKGNCMKYIWRMSYKGKAKEDTLKAQWYLNRLIETL